MRDLRKKNFFVNRAQKYFSKIITFKLSFQHIQKTAKESGKKQKALYAIGIWIMSPFSKSVNWDMPNLQFEDLSAFELFFGYHTYYILMIIYRIKKVSLKYSKIWPILNRLGWSLQGPDSTVEDSTAGDFTAELYLPSTNYGEVFKNADSTAELKKCRIYGGT